MQVASSPSKKNFEKKRDDIMVRNNYNELNNATLDN
jgi:hypothetical protein